MGSKNKLKRFKENETFNNVFQPTREEVVGNEFPLLGKWNLDFFKNDNPIIIELGCGKGEYSVGLAERYPDKNFVGIDIKGARFWRGAKTAVDEGMHNVAFVRTQIELINHIFADGEVSEIWITFPDRSNGLDSVPNHNLRFLYASFVISFNNAFSSSSDFASLK